MATVKLMTEEIKRRLPKLGSIGGGIEARDAVAVVKFFKFSQT